MFVQPHGAGSSIRATARVAPTRLRHSRPRRSEAKPRWSPDFIVVLVRAASHRIVQLVFDAVPHSLDGFVRSIPPPRLRLSRVNRTQTGRSVPMPGGGVRAGLRGPGGVPARRRLEGRGLRAGGARGPGVGRPADIHADALGQPVVEAGLQPLRRAGDLEGPHWRDGAVSAPAGFREAFHALAEGGWFGVAGNPAHGGQGLPKMLAAPLEEMLWSANANLYLYGALTIVRRCPSAPSTVGGCRRRRRCS